MQVTYKVSDKFEVTATGGDHKEVFTQLASLAEVFGVDKCGKCGCEDIYPRVRTVGKFKFFEMVCKNTKCRAYLAYGQHQEGGSLFPQRKDPDTDEYKPNNGWQVYVPDANAEPKGKPKKKG